MIQALKYGFIMWIRNRNRIRFAKELEKADWRIAHVKGGDKYLEDLRKQLIVERTYEERPVANVSQKA